MKTVVLHSCSFRLEQVQLILNDGIQRCSFRTGKQKATMSFDFQIQVNKHILRNTEDEWLICGKRKKKASFPSITMLTNGCVLKLPRIDIPFKILQFEDAKICFGKVEKSVKHCCPMLLSESAGCCFTLTFSVLSLNVLHIVYSYFCMNSSLFVAHRCPLSLHLNVCEYFLI